MTAIEIDRVVSRTLFQRHSFLAYSGLKRIIKSSYFTNNRRIESNEFVSRASGLRYTNLHDESTHARKRRLVFHSPHTSYNKCSALCDLCFVQSRCAPRVPCRFATGLRSSLLDYDHAHWPNIRVQRATS